MGAEVGTIEETKDWLKEFRQLQQSYDQLIERFCQMQEAATSPHSPGLDGMPHGSTNPVDRIGSTIAKLDSLRRRVEAAAEKKNAFAAEIQEAVDKIGGTSWAAKRTVIECRYLDLLSWPETTAVLYSREPDYDLRYDTFLRRTFYIHAEALAALAAVRKELGSGE